MEIAHGRKIPSSSYVLLKTKDGGKEKGVVENWCKSLHVVPMQNWLKEKKMETFWYENLEVKVLSQQNWDRKEAGESYFKTGGLVLSYACRYSGVWSCGASEAFLLLLTARNVENTQGATLVKIPFYLFWLCFCFFFNCFKRNKGGGLGDIQNPSHSCLCKFLSEPQDSAVSSLLRRFRAGPCVLWAVTLCKELAKLLILQDDIKTLSAAQVCGSEREIWIILRKKEDVNSSMEICWGV